MKTSTGFSRGGATLEDVELMCAVARGRMEIKAAGGIRDLATAKALLRAGASRLGCSRSVPILKEALAHGSRR